MTENIRNISIIGSGTMGSGIASSFLISGFNLIIYDIDNKSLERSGTNIKNNLKYLLDKKKLNFKEHQKISSKINYTTELADLKNSDFIIEAAIENSEVKQNIFKSLNCIIDENIIIASNTSSLSIASLSKMARNPSRFIGMHFFNPANIMKLVEIIISKFTSEKTIQITQEVTKKINKIPVLCKDTPAFIVNRIARSYYGEALKILGEGGIEIEKLDNIMEYEGGFKMGPFKLMDLIGIDINYTVTQSVYEAYYHDPKYKPHYIQKNMVESNLLGKKTKQGFYKY